MPPALRSLRADHVFAAIVIATGVAIGFSCGSGEDPAPDPTSTNLSAQLPGLYPLTKPPSAQMSNLWARVTDDASANFGDTIELTANGSGELLVSSAGTSSGGSSSGGIAATVNQGLPNDGGAAAWHVADTTGFVAQATVAVTDPPPARGVEIAVQSDQIRDTVYPTAYDTSAFTGRDSMALDVQVNGFDGDAGLPISDLLLDTTVGPIGSGTMVNAQSVQDPSGNGLALDTTLSLPMGLPGGGPPVATVSVAGIADDKNIYPLHIDTNGNLDTIPADGGVWHVTGLVAIDGGTVLANQGAPNDGGTNAWPVLLEGQNASDAGTLTVTVFDTSSITGGKPTRALDVIIDGQAGGALTVSDAVLEASVGAVGATPPTRAYFVAGVDTSNHVRPLLTDLSGDLQTSVVASVLPTNASTSALQSSVQGTVGAAVPFVAEAAGCTDGSATRIASCSTGGVLNVADAQLPASLGAQAAAASLSVVPATGATFPISGTVTVTGPVAVTQSTSPWVTSTTQLPATLGALAVGASLSVTPATGSTWTLSPTGQTLAAGGVSVVESRGTNAHALTSIPVAGIQLSAVPNVVRALQFFNGTGAAIDVMLIDTTTTPTTGAVPTYTAATIGANALASASIINYPFAAGCRIVISTTNGSYTPVAGATSPVGYTVTFDN